MKTAVLRLSRQNFTDFLKKPYITTYNRLGTLKYLPNTPTINISVVVSSKHEKRAIYRNKLRRRIYSIFRQKKPQISTILYISKQAYSMEYGEIKKLFEDLLAKTK